MNCKKTEHSAKLDQLVLKKWIKGTISSEEAKKEVEKNNGSSFRDTNEFIQWTKSLGWCLNDKAIQDF